MGRLFYYLTLLAQNVTTGHRRVFQKIRVSALLGRIVFDCHSSASREKIADLITNWEIYCYTMERIGIKKLIYQTPWYQDGKACGLVENKKPLLSAIIQINNGLLKLASV